MKKIKIGHDALGRPLRLDPADRKTHAHVIGSSGSGKSKFLEWMIRQDLKNRQGFAVLDPHGTLYDEVVAYCAHHVLNRDIILLNLSSPTSIVGFNPFLRADSGSISVQVDRRIAATMHAWNVESTDQTPTLERTLRLIYTVMLDQSLGLPQVQHLIDFKARDIRSHLVDQLESPLVQAEWRELQQLKAREWRDEILSAKNRLFRFLTSPALTRFMGLPERTIDLRAVMDGGKVLLVNLAPSDELSEENARVFGALLVNEFFECARRRQKDSLGRDPTPYYLYMDEFQNFVSLDIADMLDQVRKFGLFTILAHQRFGQLNDNIIDAVLTNCRIKAVFGGLPFESAQLMAKELFIQKLDPKKIKAAIYQTKFWPKYGRDTVYTRSTGHGTSSSYSSGSGGGESLSTSTFAGDSTGYTFDNWFSMPQLSGTRTETMSTGTTSLNGSSRSWSESSTDGESYSESESVADIPIFVPVPFQELSSVQYYSLDEQLTELTAALKEQYPRHCFIKIQGEETEPMLVPRVESPYTPPKNVAWYREKRLADYKALPAAEVDSLIQAREAALLHAASPEIIFHPRTSPKDLVPIETIWTRTATDTPPAPKPVITIEPIKAKPVGKRGPKTDLTTHIKAANVVQKYGEDWASEDNLLAICEQLDTYKIPIPKTWATLREHPARSWSKSVAHHRDLVKKALKYHCDVAAAAAAQLPLTFGDS